jgi:aldehyde dehydrogenase (NAD+)
MLAAVCGNVSIWKPSEKTPLCAIACMNIISEVLEANNVPAGTFSMIVGDSTIGQLMSNDHQIPLISATGSTRMGKSVAETVAKRLGRTLLELGGNNAIIVSQHGDMNLALQATVFASVGTTGQRCTTSRRLIVHESVYDTFKDRLVKVYEQLQTRIGSPLDQGTLIGPLIDEHAVKMMMDTLAEAKKAGANILVGGEQKVVIGYEGGCYVTPTIVETTNDQPFVQRETFAPITYLLKYKTIEEAIEMQNNVPQGLSSSIFSNNIRETELFLSALGSDCGIANVNIGPSGAEIGGAFGGEKETGGGRESGSDSWKAYMRRQTVTINYSDQLPLAQGIKFDV